MLNFVNDTESEVRLDYLKQFCITDDDIELIAPLPENQNYIDFMFEIASHGKNEEILMAVLPCMLSYSYIFRNLGLSPQAENQDIGTLSKIMPMNNMQKAAKNGLLLQSINVLGYQKQIKSIWLIFLRKQVC